MSDYKNPPSNDFFIGKGVSFKGEAKVPNHAVINGDFNGKLETKTLKIESDGVVSGNTTADDVTVHGELNSELNCRNLLSIESSGVVNGRLKYGEIEIARGGRIIGNMNVG
jgi:cytoskeletal protein CcmA (bactofilin family)